MDARRCSECGESLSGRSALTKTCSPRCRNTRSRRIRRQRREVNKLPEHLKVVQQVVTEDRGDVVKKVVEEEIRPVVREAITEDVMQSIRDLVALSPAAIAAIEDDLTGSDPVLRNKAYTLLVKYTIGHNALVESPDEEENKNLTVNFQMPRPDDEVPADAEEIKQCDSCGIDKPASSFVGSSNRCTECFERAKEMAQQLVDRNEDAD